MSDVLTLNQLGHLADIERGVVRHKKLRWYPEGPSSPEVRVEMRAFTAEGGGALYDPATDVRDTFVWCSGMFEHWFKVRDLADALANAVDGNDMGGPMAIIEEVHT